MALWPKYSFNARWFYALPFFLTAFTCTIDDLYQREADTMSRHSRRPVRKPLGLNVETLEKHILLNHDNMLNFISHGHSALKRSFASISATSRPDLDAYSWNLAHNSRDASRLGLSGLSHELVKHSAYAAMNGWGTLLEVELQSHPTYTSYHHLAALLTPPSATTTPQLSSPIASGNQPATPPIASPA